MYDLLILILETQNTITKSLLWMSNNSETETETETTIQMSTVSYHDTGWQNRHKNVAKLYILLILITHQMNSLVHQLHVSHNYFGPNGVELKVQQV